MCLLRSKWFLIPYCTLILVLIFSFIRKLNTKEISILEMHGTLKAYPHADESTGGNSTVDSFTFNENGCSFNYTLRDGVKYPNADINLYNDSGWLDFTNYHFLEITIDSISPFQQYIQISCGIDGHQMKDLPIESMPLRHLLNGKKGTYQIPLSAFKVPEWWKTEFGKNVKINWKKIKGISIGNADHGNLNTQQHVALSNLRITRNMPYFALVYLAIIVAIPLLGICGIKIYYLLQLKEVYIKDLKIESTQVVDCSSRIFSMIEKHYTNPELSQKLLARMCGVSPNYITHIVKIEKKKGYRDYINSLRLDRAQKMLIETDTSITTIAIDAGYNYPTTFNRIFKNEVGMSPTAFREQNKTSH